MRQHLPFAPILVILLLLGGIVPASAETAADSTSAPAEPQATLTGTVVDESGEPVAGAEVTVEWYRETGRTRSTATTDHQGQFEFSIPRTSLGGRLIRASADSGQRQAAHRLPWEAKEVADSIELTLRLARRVEVHVVDKVGEPVAGARAGVLGNYDHLVHATTDDAGRAVFLVPRDEHVAYVYAFQSGKGADYRAYVLARGQEGDQKAEAPEAPDEPIELKLEGATALRVRVVETDGTPIAGIEVYPWLLKKPDQAQDLNLSYLHELIKTPTDENGEAVIDWLPTWNERSVVVWPVSKEHTHTRGVYDPTTGDGTLTIQLDRLVPIRGRATLPDGLPAAGIDIAVVGAGYQTDDFRATATTDEEGRYEIKAAPNMVYLVVVQSNEWASVPHTGFALWPGQPIENLDFQLRPATRVFGRVTVGPNREPVKDQQIYVQQQGADANNMEGVELPNPEQSNRWIQPSTAYFTKTDADGRFEVFVGAGEFWIQGPSQTESQKFEITDESEREFNFHAERPEKGILRGTVVSGDQPVAGAKITGIYRSPRAGRDLVAATDESGRFEVERELHRTVLHVTNADRTLAGVVEIAPDDETVTIPIAPLATAAARLIDAESKAPLTEREIVYGVKVPRGDDDAPWRTSFGGTTTTGADGRFTLANLILGQQYDINVTVRNEDNPNDASWYGVGNVTPDEPSEIELGDLEFTLPQPPPTPKERVAQTFAVPKTPVERFEQALADARLSRQAILVLFAGADDEVAQSILTVRYEQNSPEERELARAFDPFQIVAVDTSPDKRADAQGLAERLSVKLGDESGDFVLLFADGDGEVLEALKNEGLVEGGKIDHAALRAPLEKHAPPALDAQKLLDEALAEATAHDKRIIIEETATWCGPCWRLARFLDKHKERWQDDYILVKMDHRWTGAAEIMKEMRAGASGGIPWWAILDGDGKVLITSNNDEGDNIGFPSSDTGKAHFQKMLESTAPRMTKEQIAALVGALDE